MLIRETHYNEKEQGKAQERERERQERDVMDGRDEIIFNIIPIHSYYLSIVFICARKRE